jgi:flavin reductase (DIM6/NTAB) family NADH-FMN oxidoreductase RutF
MASVCTPVTVVTAIMDGRPHGTTVSAFSSLSLRPPMVLVALNRQSRLLRLIRTTGRFGVNVLGSGQAELALAFARSGDDRFDRVAWTTDCGLPRLPDTVAWLACEIVHAVDGGDHMIALGQVIDASHQQELDPLTYYQRAFGSYASTQETWADGS